MLPPPPCHLGRRGRQCAERAAMTAQARLLILPRCSRGAPARLYFRAAVSAGRPGFARALRDVTASGRRAAAVMRTMQDLKQRTLCQRGSSSMILQVRAADGHRSGPSLSWLLAGRWYYAAAGGSQTGGTGLMLRSWCWMDVLVVAVPSYYCCCCSSAHQLAVCSSAPLLRPGCCQACARTSTGQTCRSWQRYGFEKQTRMYALVQKRKATTACSLQLTSRTVTFSAGHARESLQR